MLMLNFGKDFFTQSRKDARKNFKQYFVPLRLCVRMILVSLLVLSSVAFVVAQQQRTSPQQTDATTVFRSARDLITDGEWAKAQQKFSEYVAAFPNEKNI